MQLEQRQPDRLPQSLLSGFNVGVGMKELAINNIGNQTMTLKEITDLLDVRHSNAMVTVAIMAESPEFGLLEKTSARQKTGFGERGIDTYILKGKQIDAVKARLMFNRSGTGRKSNVIYLITDGEYTKIGIGTGNATNRLKQFQTGNPKKLWIEFETIIDNASSLELFLHNKFKNKRLQGEWFSLDKSDIDFIKALTMIGIEA